jgi:hypothetical protein
MMHFEFKRNRMVVREEVLNKVAIREVLEEAM